MLTSELGHHWIFRFVQEEATKTPWWIIRYVFFFRIDIFPTADFFFPASNFVEFPNLREKSQTESHENGESLIQGSLNYQVLEKDQKMQIYGNFKGSPN